MGIYRGAGGSGDAVNDSSSEALITIQARDQALAAQAAAEAARDAAQLAETNAETAETNAETAETNAETAATNAANSASAASTSASNAASSASAASTSASNASTSASNAASSASAASTSASNAAASASTATTQATNASNSASAAATSATNASNSASAAATSATNAANSATAAQTAQTAAELAETNAETAETNAETAETNAAASASAAATSASNASTSASNAATSATNASNSASAAATSATNASNSASAAATSASNAATSESNAATSASNAAASYDSFDDRYLGAKSSAPTLDNDGNALLTGALYFNTTTNEMKVWSGSAWLNAYASLSGALLATNNLSDLNNTATARDNLGVEIGVDVQAYDADTAKYDDVTANFTGTLQNGGSNVVVDSDIGVTVQAYDAQLADVAGLTPADNNFIVGNGTNFVTESGSTARTSLGLGTIATQDANNVAVTGGSINGTTVGASTPSTGSFTSLTDSGNLTFTGTGNRITGDFSNTTVANRVLFQTSTTNGNTSVGVITNGTAVTSSFLLHNSSDSANASRFISLVSSSEASLRNDFTGTGGYVPLTMYTGGSERLRIDTSGNVGIGTSSPSYTAAGRGNLNIAGSSSAILGFQIGGSAKGYYFHNGTDLQMWNEVAGANVFGTNGLERMRIDSSGNVGIGTSSPAYRLDVSSSGGSLFRIARGSVSYGAFLGTSESFVGNFSNNALCLITNDTERMRIDSSGNVGIGTSSPAILGGNYKNLVLQGASTTNGGYYFTQTSDGAQVGQIGVDTGVIYIGSRSNHPTAFTTNNAERMRITSGGDLLVGTTSQPGGVSARQVIQWSTAQVNAGLSMRVDTTSSTSHIFFQNPNNTVGSVSTNGSTTSFNTSSDYRLKENIAPMTGALGVVSQLKPVTYNWKVDGSSGQGFIAHELQEVVPDCVTGKKDEVDAEGKPVYQGVDTSFLVATLTAALQEAHGLIKDLQSRVDALESK